jgi:hypothetical protein
MKSIKTASIFKLSLISSLLLFFDIMFSQALANIFSLFAILIDIPVILFFAIVSILSLVFWIKRSKDYAAPFSPLIINLLFLIAIIILPLNYIRNRIDFFINETDYNRAYELAINAHPDSTYYNFVLPGKFKSLSTDDGQVDGVNKEKAHAVLFYTFRGVPDGQIGFVKVSNDKNADTLINQLFGKVNEKKDLGNSWYYVNGR